MTIIQKNLIRRYEYEFEPNHMVYRIRDWGEEREEIIPYEKISPDLIQKRKGPLPMFRKLALGCLFLGAIMAAANEKHFATTAISGAFFLSSLIFILFYRFLLFGYINYMNEKGGRIFSIMQGKNSDVLQEKIRENWYRRLRELYAFIDKDRPPFEQVNKLQWLKKRDIISQAEYDAFIRQIKGQEMVQPDVSSFKNPVLN